MTYQYLIETMGHKIDKTRSDIKKIANNLPEHAPSGSRSASPTPSTSLEPVLGAGYSTIPLYPRQEDYLGIKHWTSETWIALQHPKGGIVMSEQTTDAINIQFWEDELGNRIPRFHQKRVTSTMRSIWQDMYDRGNRLGPFMTMGWDIRKEFRERMEAKHPWLHLCADHWKADQLWMNHFSGWTPATAESGKGKQPKTLKRERCTEENAEAGPSQKKLKTLDQQPTRPKPTKKPAARVSIISFVLSTRY